MGLLSFLSRKGASDAPAAELAPVELARQRARRRLIGAAVLVLAGVLGFPLLFDTAPRPVPADIAVEIAGKDAPPSTKPPAASQPAPAVATAPPRRASDEGVVTDSADGQGQESAVRRPMPATASAPSSDRPPVKPPAAVPPRAAEPTAADAARAKAALEGRPDAKAAAPVADAAHRFVVQVGAFSEPSAVRDMRARVERLGLKTYTQDVETSAGKRIRVRLGPYADRAEADKVAAQLRQAGLAPAVAPL